ncbi:unnamed protein product [Caenorhabditis sp. 36 PRJEB53466]|nr:unnamed protein product [Caenorhabditis sp. 36 PRJEB53466]
MKQIVPLMELSCEQVARNIINHRLRPSNVCYPVPSPNKVFAHAMVIWSGLDETRQNTIEASVFGELAELEITEADFGDMQLHSRFFPLFMKRSLVSLTIGYEGSVVNGDEHENAGDEIRYLSIVELLERISSTGTRHTLMHLDVSSAPNRRFEPNWMRSVGDLFPNLESINFIAYRGTNVADLVNCFPNLKSLYITTPGGTTQLRDICLLRNLEFLMIDDITDVPDVEELFQLRNLRVLSVPGTNSENRPFTRKFLECLERGLTLPQLRYLDCSEASTNIPYDAIVEALPNLDHLTCIGSTSTVGNLPGYKIDTIKDTLTAMEYYMRQKCFGMQLLVLRVNPMSKLSPDIPECSANELRKFQCILNTIMTRKSTDTTFAAFVSLNYPKLLRMMLDCGNFSTWEIRQFIFFVLVFFRKFNRFQFELRNMMNLSVMETVMTPGIHSNIYHPFCVEIFKNALKSMRVDELRDQALECLIYHYGNADYTGLSREDVKDGCKYLVETVYDRLSEPTDEHAQRSINKCLFVIQQLVGLRVFEEPDDVDTGTYSPHMILFFCQLLTSEELAACIHRQRIKCNILCVLLKIVCRDDHPQVLYNQWALRSVWTQIRKRNDREEHIVQIVTTAVAILAKIIVRPDRVEDELADFYNAQVLDGVQWLLENATNEPPVRMWIQWSKMRHDIDETHYLGTIAAHIYAVREYVRHTNGFPLYARHFETQEVVRDILSTGAWRGRFVDEWVVDMTRDILRIAEPGVEFERAEKREADGEGEPEDAETDAKKVKTEEEDQGPSQE